MPDNAPPESPAAGGPGVAPGPPILPPPGPPGRSLDPAGQAPGAPSPGRPVTTTGPGTAPPPLSAPVPGPAPAPTPLKPAPTRTSAAYFAVGLGLLILVLVIIFIAQNEHQSSVHFLSFHFKLPQGLIILASAVAGGLLVLIVSLARVVQLRLMARRHRKAHVHS